MLGIPPFFKEIFKHLPNALLELISWREMLLEITLLSNRLLTGKGADDARVEADKIRGSEIKLVDETSGTMLDVSSGELILKLYFAQIMKGKKIFLDFRPKHFSKGEFSLQWEPGGLWAEMDQEFVDGIRKVYLGYYNNDDALFSKGMIESGLVKQEWDEEKRLEVIEVFKEHFSNGRGAKIAFDIEVFKNSFAQIFKTLVKNKISLDKNFLYLGIMLVTLYITLNEIGGEYDVSKIFQDSLSS